MNEKKYSVVRAIISPFYRTKDRVNYDIEHFGKSRLCVIDSDESFVIDVYHGLKYDYIKTVNGVYYRPGEMEKIEDRHRYAIYSQYFGCTEEEEVIGNKIIHLLNRDYEFPDGNEVLDNIQYYDLIQREKNNKKKFLKIKR